MLFNYIFGAEANVNQINAFIIYENMLPGVKLLKYQHEI